MLQLLFFTATLAVFVYGFTTTLRTDYKKVMLYRLLTNHVKMKALYKKLEDLVFIKGNYAFGNRENMMSYDLYLAGLKKHNENFDKEMEELRTSKFNHDVEKYYLRLIHTHEHELMALQSEISRVEHTLLLHPHKRNQQSA